jgi:hypothetical protein
LNQQLISFAFGIFFGRLNAAIKLRLCGVDPSEYDETDYKYGWEKAVSCRGCVW